ncbi:MAG: hypothetical protein K6E91_10965 [Butyrivibrio sp.]|jgi:hypothetical protein|nr:hypothetical protein [Butyrivibrio sp.]
MRQLDTTDHDKALMLDLIIDELIDQYENKPPVEKIYHSRAEKIGYSIVTMLESNGFVTNEGIVSK